MTTRTAAGRGPRSLAFLLEDLDGGGVQRMTLVLARAFEARGWKVDILTFKAEGAFRDAIPARVGLIELERASMAAARLAALRADPGGFGALLRPVLLARRPWPQLSQLPALAMAMDAGRYDCIVSATPPFNIIATLAARLAAHPPRTILTERAALTVKHAGDGAWRKRYLAPLIRRAYGLADAVVTVSKALADDLADFAGVPRGSIRTIYNPVVGPELEAKARLKVAHPWAEDTAVPLVLAAGRLSAQKDFATLIRAFAKVRAGRPARLVILGRAQDPSQDGPRRAELEALARELGVAADVALPGFDPNPFAWMARADLFVLSSTFEGLPGVLIQAMACGCPVVSTDCPTGPREILEGGLYGPLVPVGDVDAMADAMARVLADPPPRGRMRERAAHFGEPQAVAAYEALIDELVDGRTAPAIRSA